MSGHIEASPLKGAWFCDGQPAVAQQEKANAGRDLVCSLTGTVITGDQRGRTLGFPTANIDIGHHSRHLRQGVYAVWLALEGSVFPGVAAFGKPMFDNHQPPLETHIFDFDADIYGRQITVHLVRYIRKPQIFSGLDSLVTAMNDDAREAREILASARRICPEAVSRLAVRDASTTRMDDQWL